MNSWQFEVEAGSAALAVTQWGDGDSTIVALHPGVGDSRIWTWCAPQWADAGHRVIAYDRRGFGRTTCEIEPYDDRADLLAVLDATSTDSAVLVGNSNGGGLALDVAIAHPQRVRSLILLAPSVGGDDYSTWVEVPAEIEQDAQIEAAQERGDFDEVNRLELRYWLDGVEQPEGRVAGAPRDLMHEMNGFALRAPAVGDVIERPDAWRSLADVEAPTLVVLGALDLPGFGPLCDSLVAGLGNARLHIMADSAHCPALDAPDELNRIVVGFA